MSYYHAINGNFRSLKVSCESSQISSSSAVPENTRSSWFQQKRRCNQIDKCVSSKSALLTLFWVFIVGMAINLPKIIVDDQYIFYAYRDPYSIIQYIIMEIPLCFYPLAGFLADNKFGQYTVVTRSLLMLLVALTSAAVLLWTSFLLQKYASYYLLLVSEILTTVSVVVMIAGMIGFNANALPFGMDQLHDSPGDHQSLFVHWYVWVWYFGGFCYICLMQMAGTLRSVSALVAILAVLLVTSLLLTYCRKRWFLIATARFNPYKLVYKVTEFARRHKVPIQRSAFTFCEDEIPSGLDLGKDKYGGPFTTEQVEDVKAFYGILKVLITMGPVFFLNIATDHIMFIYSLHVEFNHNFAEEYMFGEGWLSYCLTLFCMPLYICVIRPLFFKYIPSMLKRIGLGILVLIASLICTLVMDTVGHMEQEEHSGCMFQTFHFNSSIDKIFPARYAPITQRCLTAFFTMLFYPALYEFIISQSPQTMKGLLIGLCFAIKGLFEFLGLALVIIFTVYSETQSLPSCGMEYYIVNVGVGVAALFLYGYIAKGYRFRLRDEPCHVRRFVEEYYSKIQSERNYNYYDNIQ